MKSMSNCLSLFRNNKKISEQKVKQQDPATLFSWDFQSCPTCRVLNVAEEGWVDVSQLTEVSVWNQGRGKLITVAISLGPTRLCFVSNSLMPVPKLYWTHSAELFLCPHLETIFSVPSPSSPGCVSQPSAETPPECSAQGLTWLPPRTCGFGRAFGDLSASTLWADVEN